MKKLFLLLIVLFAISFSVDAQRNCAADDVLQQQLIDNPSLGDEMEKIEQFTQKFINNPEKLNGEIVTIPVVVHVIWKSTSQNISDAQVLSQIDILNEDFRRTNSDADNVWGNLGVDTEIEFCMATVDPDGNPTNGIQRKKTNKRSFQTNDAMKFDSQGGVNAWPASDYLNIWVCNISGGILGYAQFPGGAASTDGVVIDYQYYGNTGTATAPFDLGRTGTHEVGHWLNLRHIWGDGGCSVDDFVGDTPVSDGPNYGCSLGHVSCGTTDMVQNYMDYSDDACMNIFTGGQSTRMDALFTSGGARESLLSSGGCGEGTPPTCNDGIQNGDEEGVDCGGSNCEPCSTGGPTCSDGIQNGDEEGVDCGGSNCEPCSTGGTCDTPSGLFASNIKPKRAKLNWSAVSSATSYNVQVSVAGQGNWSTFSTSNTNITISSLTNGQSYDWRVEAVCGSDVSGYSGTCSFTAGNSGSGDCTGRLALDIQEFTLFPNPTADFISISNVEVSTVKSIYVMDMNGKIISQSDADSALNGISVYNYESGMYFMKVSFIDNTEQIKRFVVIK